jgi:2-methylisocitrate lyase-like PEP mutase family enzyme
MTSSPTQVTQVSQADKARTFRALHESGEGFIIPNPWDAGTAHLLARMGFKALATTSAGLAFSLGRPDNAISRDDVLAHLRSLSTIDLPVSADLENGFGDDPKEVAQTIRLAAEAGIVGGSIEDATNRADDPIYGRELAVERIRAAVEAARAQPFPFTLTARAENHLHGRNDLADTIARLQAYQEAGADVLYAPGLVTREDISTVLREIDRPLNVLMGLGAVTLDAKTLFGLGVRRISVGGSLARAAMGAFLRAANEMREHGTFTYASTAVSHREINAMFAREP